MLPDYRQSQYLYPPENNIRCFPGGACAVYILFVFLPSCFVPAVFHNLAVVFIHIRLRKAGQQPFTPRQSTSTALISAVTCAVAQVKRALLSAAEKSIPYSPLSRNASNDSV